MRTCGRIAAWTLAGCVILGLIPPRATATSDAAPVEVRNDYEVTGTDSVGRMLADLMEDEDAARDGAAAHGYGVSGLEVTDRTASVTYTAEADAQILIAVYDDDGSRRFVTFASGDAEAGEGTASVTFPDALPEHFILSACLADPDTLTPFTGPFIRSETDGSEDVYAILYTDGELVFQYGDTPETGRSVRSTYPVDLNGYEYDRDNYRPTTPWYDDRASITLARFADTIRPASTAYWFYDYYRLTTLDVSGLDTSNVTDMGYMFAFCSGLTTLDLSGFDTFNVTDMGYMFRDCSGLTTLDLSGFDTSNVTDMGAMFYGCHGLTTLDVSGFKTSNVTDMGGMFYECRGLTTLDVSGFDTSNVTNMAAMFDSCSGLTTLDLSGFDTSNVTDMSATFYGCRSLTTLDLSGFDTLNVTDMSWMFYDCIDLTMLDLSGFDTSNVTKMGRMFEDCRSLTTLDLSGFDTSNVTKMGFMFEGCSGLTTIFASELFSVPFDVEASTAFMFFGCMSLVGGNGTAYRAYRRVGGSYARIDGGPSAPGYFTYKSPSSSGGGSGGGGGGSWGGSGGGGGGGSW